MRTAFTQDRDYPNRCTLRYTDDAGHVVDREFFAPAGGGYVRENWGNPRQVCEHLSGGGATLIWEPTRDAQLVDLIRREWSAGRRAERRSGAARGY